MSEERITYEEFIIMFRNAPRIAYTLYDKAEDEISRLNNIINEAIEYVKYWSAYDENFNICCDDLNTENCEEILKILKGDDN